MIVPRMSRPRPQRRIEEDHSDDGDDIKDWTSLDWSSLNSLPHNPDSRDLKDIMRVTTHSVKTGDEFSEAMFKQSINDVGFTSFLMAYKLQSFL